MTASGTLNDNEWTTTKPAASSMMTSSNGNIFRVTGPLCGEFTVHRCIPLTGASDAELWCFFDLRLSKSWVNSRDGGDLRRHCAHYDVTETRFVQTVTACLCCDHMSVFKVPCFGLTVNIPLIVSNVRKKTYVYYIFTNTTGPFDDPDSKGPWIDIDQISIPRESVRSMSDRCWSDGLCHLGTAYGADLSSVQWCCITMTS